jgi:hypothetical protein
VRWGDVEKCSRGAPETPSNKGAGAALPPSVCTTPSIGIPDAMGSTAAANSTATAEASRVWQAEVAATSRGSMDVRPSRGGRPSTLPPSFLRPLRWTLNRQSSNR